MNVNTSKSTATDFPYADHVVESGSIGIEPRSAIETRPSAKPSQTSWVHDDSI